MASKMPRLNGNFFFKIPIVISMVVDVFTESSKYCHDMVYFEFSFCLIPYLCPLICRINTNIWKKNYQIFLLGGQVELVKFQGGHLYHGGAEKAWKPWGGFPMQGGLEILGGAPGPPSNYGLYFNLILMNIKGIHTRFLKQMFGIW